MRLTPFERHRLTLVVVLVAWCAALIAARVAMTGSRSYAFLGWNLFLAGVPMAASLTLRRIDPVRRPLRRAVLFVVWLVFLPNAPYIVTDLFHLDTLASAPEWFDLAMLLSAAVTGLLLGYLSVLDVHGVLEARFGWLRGWMATVAALGLSGYGIFLGRFLRFNSWEVVTGPRHLLRTIGSHLLDPLAHRGAMGVTLLYGAGLVLGYATLRALIRNETTSPNGS